MEAMQCMMNLQQIHELFTETIKKYLQNDSLFN